MLRKEVIHRMVAKPATSDDSRLSVMLQWGYARENILFVPLESFALHHSVCVKVAYICVAEARECVLKSRGH